MDTKVIEKFSIEAREQLLKDMEQRLYAYGLDDAGRAEADPEADAVRGTVLTATEKTQRAELYRRIEQEGVAAFASQMAYTWFNRFAALRYMELHDFLPNHVRMLSAADGTFDPECLHAATTLDLPGLERTEVAQLIQAGDDEGLYRAIIIAQMNELASFLPTVFGTVAADALTLPANLLRKSEFNVLYRLVTDIPEDAWQDVEILGWMYQFYNSEVKAEFFKSMRKAAEADLAPATQLFTPEWIVRYMVDNSLGRLWMLNHPESRLRDRAHAEDPRDRLMEYYIEPDEEHEDFIRVTSPEGITFCDPACGSGHILVYAFKMLMAIYEECGYREREIPELILTKNLSGFEIDPRAAQIATLALALCAREHDRRFFGRGITADITVLQDIRIDADELLLASPLHEKQKLLESLAHLGEIGSLLQPTAGDVAALETDLVDAEGDNLFASHANAGVEQALTVCRALNRRFDVVVANPPYMGSSSFNPFMSKWVKTHYPDSCKDLCTAFIERGYALAREQGYNAMVTMQSWMFLGSFEKMRNRVIDEKAILTMAHLGARAFDAIGGEVVSVTADVLYNGKASGKGSYVRLVDTVGSEPKREKLLEAIQSPNCGYFYQADATTFHDIPGSPIAYWASNAMRSAFKRGNDLESVAKPRQGLATGDNSKFLREWWEVSIFKVNFFASSTEKAQASGAKWFPCNKGGGYRRWYGMNEWIIDWQNNGQALKQFPGSVIRNPNYYFKEGMSWGTISSAKLSMRYSPKGFISEHAGSMIYLDSDSALSPVVLGLANSSVAEEALKILSPSLRFTEGPVGCLPVLNDIPKSELNCMREIVHTLVSFSKHDWDSQETSWDFKRNSLI